MKHIKTYENATNKLKVGYYVIASKFNNKPEVKDFFENNIGFIANVYPSKSPMAKDFNSVDISVIYDRPPDNVIKYANMMMVQGGWQTSFNDSQVIETAKTKKELKLKLAANKYNL
jgi:hypothetical protein